MKLTTVKRFLKDYKMYYKSHDKTIGSIIKHHRNERRLTLEDTAENICSVSYLCKVENNKLNASEKILPKLMERLEICETILDENLDNDWIDLTVDKSKVSKDTYEKFKDIKDYRSKLVVFAYYILNDNDPDRTRNNQLDLSEYIQHFRPKEFVFFLYLIMLNNYKNECYFNCLEIYKQILEFTEFDTIILNAKIYYIKACFKIDKTSNIIDRIDSLYKDLIDINRFDWIVELKNYELSFIAKKLSTEELSNQLNMISKNTNLNFSYIWFCHYYFKVMDFYKAFHYINNLKNDNQHFYIMYLLTLDKLKKENDMILALNITPFSKLKYSYEIVINYLKIKYIEKNDSSYLRKELIINKKMVDEVVISDYLYAEALRILKQKHFYKESVELLEKQIVRYKIIYS